MSFSLPLSLWPSSVPVTAVGCVGEGWSEKPQRKGQQPHAHCPLPSTHTHKHCPNVPISVCRGGGGGGIAVKEGQIQLRKIARKLRETSGAAVTNPPKAPRSKASEQVALEPVQNGRTMGNS